MVSRALRILGLLLVSSTAAASGAGQLQPSSSAGDSGWARQLSARSSAPHARTAAHRTRGRDASGRVWSNIDLGGPRPARAAAWTTERLGSWSYSYSSDGTRCVSTRTAQSVFISCQ
jgi:hypothetical protein